MSNATILIQNHMYSGFDPNLLPPDEKNKFDEAGVFVEYKKNDIIYGEGASPKGAYLLLKGMVKVIQTTSDGTEQIIFFFSTGELFGYRALLSKDKHNISAICMEICEIKFIDAFTFEKLIETLPVFSRQLLTRVCHEFSILINRITLYAQKGIRERMAYALLILNEKYKVRNSKTNISNIKISRTNLAAFIGTSIDVVSRNVKYYTERNIIRTRGKSIFIIDFDYLYKASGII